MQIIINNSTMVPLYEQIVEQVKRAIRDQEVHENDLLPSVRSLARDLKISALTVKKAYDALEAEGLVVTVHGKGTYIAPTNSQALLEEQRKDVQNDLEQVIQKAQRYGLPKQELIELFNLLMEEE